MPKPNPAMTATTSGVVTIVLTVFAMALADAVIKASSADMTLWQIYVLRSLLVLPALMMLGAHWRLSAGLGWVLLRSLALVGMYLGIYAAIPLLDLSVIAASLYTAPLFIVCLSALVLGEVIRTRQWLAILIGLAGVLVIVRPTAAGFSPLALIPISAAFLYAVAAILTQAKCAKVPARTLALWLNVALLGVGIGASLLIRGTGMAHVIRYPFLFGYWSMPDGNDWAVIVLLAGLMLSIGVGLARAYQAPRPQVIATFDYSFLIFATFWGYVFFGEIPDGWTMAGMLMIAGAGGLVMTGGPSVRAKGEAADHAEVERNVTASEPRPCRLSS